MAGEGEIVGGWLEMNGGWWPEVNRGGIARGTARNEHSYRSLFCCNSLDYFSRFFSANGRMMWLLPRRCTSARASIPHKRVVHIAFCLNTLQNFQSSLIKFKFLGTGGND